MERIEEQRRSFAGVDELLFAYLEDKKDLNRILAFISAVRSKLSDTEHVLNEFEMKDVVAMDRTLRRAFPPMAVWELCKDEEVRTQPEFSQVQAAVKDLISCLSCQFKGRVTNLKTHDPTNLRDTVYFAFHNMLAYLKLVRTNLYVQLTEEVMPVFDDFSYCRYKKYNFYFNEDSELIMINQIKKRTHFYWDCRSQPNEDLLLNGQGGYSVTREEVKTFKTFIYETINAKFVSYHTRPNPEDIVFSATFPRNKRELKTSILALLCCGPKIKFRTWLQYFEMFYKNFMENKSLYRNKFKYVFFALARICDTIRSSYSSSDATTMTKVSVKLSNIFNAMDLLAISDLDKQQQIELSHLANTILYLVDYWRDSISTNFMSLPLREFNEWVLNFFVNRRKVLFQHQLGSMYGESEGARCSFQPVKIPDPPKKVEINFVGTECKAEWVAKFEKNLCLSDAIKNSTSDRSCLLCLNPLEECVEVVLVACCQHVTCLGCFQLLNQNALLKNKP